MQKTKTIIKVLVLSLLLLASIRAAAQPYCMVRTFSITQGMTTNNITHLSQDEKGMMWFSSLNGMWSFDGYEFTPYRDFGEYHSMTSQRYISMRVTSCATVYLTDFDRRLYLYDCLINRFTNLQPILKKQGIDMQVHDIISLKNGHTWLIGTRDSKPGLVRLDDRHILEGKGIEVVEKEPLHAPTYKAVVCADGSELIYGEIGVYTLGRGKIYSNGVKTLAQIGSNVYWGGGGNIVAKYDVAKKKISTFKMPESVGEVTNMVVLDKKRIVCGTDQGVAVIHLPSCKVELINVQSLASPSNKVTNLFLDTQHRLWVFTESDGMTVIQPDMTTKKWLMAKAQDIMTQTTCKYTVWLQDNNGTVWAVPRNGTFAYFDEQSHTLVPYPLYEQENSQYTIPEIKRTFIDRQKNLWLTGLHSFNMLSFGKYNFRKVQATLFGNMRSLLIDRHGNVWMGNEKGNLMVYDREDKLLGYVSPSGKIVKEPTVFCPNIYSLLEDKRGRKWIGTKEDGLFLLSADGKVENFKKDDNSPYSLSDNRVNSMAQDSKGRIWIGTYGGGLNLIDEHDGKMRFISSRSPHGVKTLGDNDNIRNIAITKDGTVILSTTRGLACFSDKFKSPDKIAYHYLFKHNDDNSNTHFDVIQALVTRKGRIFMATINGDVSELSAKDLLTKPSTRKILSESISEGPINGMFEDTEGYLWIVRENNIDRYNPDNGKSNTFWPGKKSNYCDFTEAVPLMNSYTGRAVICTQDGYLTFCPKNIKASCDVPQIAFTKVLVNGDKHETPILYNKEIKLPAEKHSFTISFAALDYTSSKYIRYAYKMEGIDKQWNNIGYDHRVSFNDLPAGRYRLLVKSTNSDGQWVDNIAQITIHATPAWWQTWWAYAIYTCIVGWIAYMIVRNIKMRRRITIDRIISERKTMLYREASHKLRTPLTLIGGPIVEVLKSKNLTNVERDYLETARASSRNMLELVDDMLSDNMEGSYFVDDENARIFAEETEEDNNAVTANSGIRILVVEDNADLRKFLVSLLCSTYSVITAENGKLGLEKAISEQPDFILSDVTMPVMDGLTMVGMIKKNPNICHIPIIILSARASIEDKSFGIEQGIDDYITKPFSAQYLKRRMAEVIANRMSEQQKSMDEISSSGNNSDYSLTSAKIVDYDREMMSRLMEYLEKNIANSDLRVDDMAAAVNLGRTVFYNKLKSIVGMSPTDFVRSLRVKRASEMIRQSKMTISEISIAVGFNDQRYFSRVFKKEMGMTPSEYRESAGDF